MKYITKKMYKSVYFLSHIYITVKCMILKFRNFLSVCVAEKKRYVSLLLLVLVLLSFIAHPIQQANAVNVLVDFNSTNDLTDKFTPNKVGAQFTNSSSGGIGNTGAISVPSGSTELWATKQGYTVTGAGDIYTFSAFFKIAVNSGYGGLGFIAGSPVGSLDFSGQPAKGIGMAFHGGGGSFVNNQVHSNVSWPPDLALNTWYKMIFTVTAKGSNRYDLKFEIWNTDSNGNLGTQKTEKTLNNVLNNDVGNASVISIFFSAAGNRMSYVDNFEMELEGGAVIVEEGEPIVQTTEVSSITATSAESGGTVTDDQGSAVTARGVCVSTTTNPTTADTCTTDGSGEGSYSSSLSGLSSSTLYYVRAYATNSVGTSYGSERSFTTGAGATPTPTNTPTPTPTNTPTPTPTNTPTPTSIPPTSTPTPTPTAIPSPTPTHVPAQQIVQTINTVPKPEVCTAAAPIGSPNVFKIVSTQTSARLYVSPINGVSDYYISYGTSPDAQGHGVSLQLSDSGVGEYTVNDLTAGVSYYFKARGQNGCRPGEWSTIQSVTTLQQVATQTEETKDSPLVVKEVAIQTKPQQPCTYTVQTGDSLWEISEKVLGDGGLYTQLIEKNSNKYPAIAQGVDIGWELSIPCDLQNETGKETGKTEDKAEAIKSVTIFVEHQGKPLAFADVELHSDPQYGKTDKNGKVTFTNVEPGDHTVYLSYNDYKTAQSVSLENEQDEYEIKLTVEMKKDPFIQSVIPFIIGVIFASVVLVIIVIIRRKK